MRESLSPSGRLTLRLVDPCSGRLERELRVDNIVTLDGRRFLARLLRAPDGVALPTAIRIVAGSPDSGPPSAPALENTGLDQQRIQADAIVEEPQLQLVDGQPRIVAMVRATFEPNTNTENITLNEAGVELAYADGSTVLYNRVTFESIIKAVLLRMELSWEVVF